MSDGCAENGRAIEQPNTNLRRRVGSDTFAQAIARTAVAQVCEAEGFQSFQQSALEVLSDVAVRYIYHVGKMAHLYANAAGRTDCNAMDVVQGLEDLGSGEGFTGASDVAHCLANSGIIQDITQYVGEVEEIPFAFDLPQFPVVKERKPAPSFSQIGKEPPEHIPSWLPAFPEPHKLDQSSKTNERGIDRAENTAQAKKHSKVEQPLVNLQQRFPSNGSEGPSLHNGEYANKAKQVAESNPFLAPPFHFGERGISLVVPPAKLSNEVAVEAPVLDDCVVENHVSVVETFAPAIEAMKSRLCDFEEGQRKCLVDHRPAVQFKIGAGRKSFGGANLSSYKKGPDRISPWFGNDSEKDDKKRRAEKILKESMENHEELAQL